MAIKEKITAIHIDQAYCKGCDICIELCPTDVFVRSELINSKGYYVPVPVRLEKCNGCRICDLICPEMAVILISGENSNKINEKTRSESVLNID